MTRDDTERLTQWVRDHGQAVRGFLGAMLRDDDLADDLMQEVFCRAWQYRKQYAERGKERAYLLRIADRLARGRRRQVPKVSLDLAGYDPPDNGASPLEQMERFESRKQLSAALEVLSDIQRRTVLLRFFGELSFEEIAGRLGCPLNTVLSHCRRGLLALRQLLLEEAV